MKTSNRCPKCDSSKIIMYKGTSYNQITIGATTKWGISSAVINRYFCVDCGYTEEYAQMNDKFLAWANKMLDKQ
ncbi:MAG: hypothetical protein ACI8P3_003284, partial [Saprospiraceae bacterium]